jgi:hypothetical protein
MKSSILSNFFIATIIPHFYDNEREGRKQMKSESFANQKKKLFFLFFIRKDKYSVYSASNQIIADPILS